MRVQEWEDLQSSEDKKVKNKFKSQSLDVMQKEFITCLQGQYEKLLESIDEYCPDGRYKSIAITKLEEVAMFATKSISHEWDGKK